RRNAERRPAESTAEAFLLEYVLAPVARVFVIPDELVAMHKLFEDYRQSPRTARDETPKDWTELRESVKTDPTSLFGIVFIKPKQRMLLDNGLQLAALRQMGRTGYAVAAYQRKHGKYPERLG